MIGERSKPLKARYSTMRLELSPADRKFLISVLNAFYEEFPSKLTDKKCRDMIERLEGEALQWT